jgi:demethylmenaquinone methyltransferase/2-methoxy-6-polyprenyl-1,4-benzoquinol methylase
LGRLVAGDARAYTYLPESAAAFLEPERLADVLRSLGLTGVTIRRLGFGAVALTTARKP